MPIQGDTHEKAVERGRKSGVVRRENKKRLTQIISEAMTFGLPEDLYSRHQTLELREDIKRTRQNMRDATEAQEKNWLGALLVKLIEAERQCAGRPLPGTLRPAPSKAKGPTFNPPE